MIHDVTLTLERGTMNVLLGPTLAGKTTLMGLMAGLDRPSSERLVLDGGTYWGAGAATLDCNGVPAVRQLPEPDGLREHSPPLRVARVRSAEIESRVRQAAQLLRLENLLGQLLGQLRAASSSGRPFVRAPVKRADVVLLDEPLANLHYKLREELREQLPRIFAELNATLVYATTEPTEALLLGASCGPRPA